MRVFFFLHPIAPFRVGHGSPVPGRVGFDVEGSAVDLRCGELVDWSGTVYGDGFESNQPGSNVDPHIFSDLIPWHLTYCLIDKRAPKTYVQNPPTGLAPNAILSEAVQRGDAIVFGGTFNTNVFWADTVLRVDHTAPLPIRDSRLRIVEDIESYWPLATGEPFDARTSRERLLKSKTYRYGLVDSEPGGMHNKSDIAKPIQIIGRRGKPAETCRRGLVAELREGLGFNFIPLAKAQNSCNQDLLKRPGLFNARFPSIQRLLGPRSSGVVTLPEKQGVDLLSTIVEQADVLVVDQRPLKAPKLRERMSRQQVLSWNPHD